MFIILTHLSKIFCRNFRMKSFVQIMSYLYGLTVWPAILRGQQHGWHHQTWTEERLLAYLPALMSLMLYGSSQSLPKGTGVSMFFDSVMEDLLF